MYATCVGEACGGDGEVAGEFPATAWRSEA
jgi:hypothetical protein